MNRAVLLILLALAGCTPAPAAPLETSFSQNGVTVTIVLTERTIQTTFRPDRPGFHLYSIDLPADGIDGIGRPTAVGVEGSLQATGPLTTPSPVRELTLQGLEITLPVYPDGPITTVLPINSTATGIATIIIGYAACSETEGCLPPVTDHRVTVQVSDGGLAFTPALTS